MSVKGWNIADQTTHRAFEETRRVVNSLDSNFFKEAKLLTEDDGNTELTFALGVTRTFKHKLGREYVGFLLVYREGPAEPYVDVTKNDNKKNEISLVVSSNLTCKILIF